MNRRKIAFCWSLALVISAATLLCGSASSQSATVIHNFGGPTGGGGSAPIDGANPYAGLTFDSQGNLYGTTARGGGFGCLVDGCGTLFQLQPQGGGWRERILVLFGDGGTPIAPVVLDQHGNIYGTFFCTQDCFNRYGGVFELFRGANGTWKLSETDPFDTRGCATGACGVALDDAGHLYGVTQQAANSRYGEVFRTTHASLNWSTFALYDFTGGSDGANPSITLTFDSSSNIYGTTSAGGANGLGAVYKLTNTGQNFGWPESVLYSFQGGSDGTNPNGGVIFDAAGNLYGTTVNGGTAGVGTVFKLTPQQNGSWSESILYSFQGGTDASHPANPLTFDAAGNLYGVAGGGTHGHGAVFKLVPAQGQWSESLFYSFTGGLDGDTPSGGVIFDSAGNLYGTTVYGGAYPTCSDEPYCGGVAYKITP
jgi:uncharacterized repeat protein (TIGR03803 family)